ncbi:hypothetical protein ACFLV6_01560 [Chloroflexota bacterium]
MSKILRLLTVSLLLASIMVATIGGGAVFAGQNGDQTQTQTRDCTDDCVPDGDGPPWLED